MRARGKFQDFSARQQEKPYKLYGSYNERRFGGCAPSRISFGHKGA